jgi:hypothetical protein
VRHHARRAITLAAVAVLAVLAGGSASAYWTSTGAGSGAAAIATTTDELTLTPATPTAQLAPGATANVVLTMYNPNTFAVHVGSLSLDTSHGTGGFDVDGDHLACAVTALSFTTQTGGGSGWTVGPKAAGADGSLAITLTNSLTMNANAASACQNASFIVYLVAAP